MLHPCVGSVFRFHNEGARPHATRQEALGIRRDPHQYIYRGTIAVAAHRLSNRAFSKMPDSRSESGMLSSSVQRRPLNSQTTDSIVRRFPSQVTRSRRSERTAALVSR